MKHFTEDIGWTGIITATAVSLDGVVTMRKTFKNYITDAGLNLLRDGLVGAATDLKIKYIAVGTDSTPPASGDVVLGAEVFRKQFLQVSGLAGAGQAYTQFILAATEANVSIQELGWFAGPSATAAADSGILVARTLFAHVKTNLESLYLDRTDTIARG